VKKAFEPVEGTSALIRLATDSPRLLELLDDSTAFEAIEETELSEPLRLVAVDEVPPPNPEKPSVAGFDSSGKRRPVLVIFLSHMRWYRSSFALPFAPAPTPATLADDEWTLSPIYEGHESERATEWVICTFPGTVMGPVMRMIHFEGFCAGSRASPVLSGRRWMRTWGVGGLAGIGRLSMSVRLAFI
jgi:hypothetical protein